MTVSPNNNREEIEKQAARWTARLETGPLTAGEQSELAGWLDANPDHRWLLSRYRELCALLRTQLPVLTDAGEADAFIDGVAARHRRWRWAGRALAAAASLAIAGLVWSMWPQNAGTGFGERRALALADGSRVELNAQTELVINLGRHERRVTLGRGEAFFRVAHDPARPFFVATPGGAVRVTGTVFNVRSTAAGRAEVTVLEGAVRVQSAAAAGEAQVPIPLGAGEQAVLGDARVAVRTLSPESAQNATAWRVGQAAFESEPLADALGRFAAYHVKPVTVAADAAALRVGGRYSLDDREGFLAAVEQALPVGVVHGADGSVRVVARPPARR